MLPVAEELLDFYPFHSFVRGIGVSDVYHSHPACQIGQSIAGCYRRAGNPHHWPECPYCRLHQPPATAQAAARGQADHRLLPAPEEQAASLGSSTR